MTRRTFVRHATCLTALASRSASAAPGLNPNSLAKFVDPLPIPEIAKAAGLRPAPDHSSSKVPYFRVPMRQVEYKLHRDLPATPLWCYGGASPGPTFETRSGQPLLIEWPNELPARHFLPIDHSLHGAEIDTPEVRGVVHVHGAKAPPESDGYPEDWYVPGKSRTYFYPNRQEAAALWYHDHAMGINRLNIYAGMFGLFLIRDEFEELELRRHDGALGDEHRLLAGPHGHGGALLDDALLDDAPAGHEADSQDFRSRRLRHRAHDGGHLPRPPRPAAPGPARPDIHLRHA